jgi:WD40 repeat protein
MTDSTVLQDLDADLSAFGNFTALDVDNTGAFAVLGSRKALVLVELESPQQPVQTLHYQSRYDVTCLRWSPLTSGALASTSNSSVLIWDVDSADSLVATLRKHRRPVTDISWSPLHSSVLASSRYVLHCSCTAFD